jgi:hypothetical protein
MKKARQGAKILVFFKKKQRSAGANPTTASYNAGVVKTYYLVNSVSRL